MAEKFIYGFNVAMCESCGAGLGYPKGLVQTYLFQAEGKKVLIIAMDPLLVDFSSPHYALSPGLTAEKV